MRHYEIMIILDPNLEERTVQPSLDQFLKVVTGGGGKVEKVDIWGKRRLAYQIQKKSEGFYAVVDLTAEPGHRLPGRSEPQFRIVHEIPRDRDLRVACCHGSTPDR